MPSTWPRLYSDPSRAVAQEILLRHQPASSPPAIVRWLDKIIPALKRLASRIPPHSEPPRPFADIMAPLNRGPRPRAGAVALREPD
jgi:hypothetical protein